MANTITDINIDMIGRRDEAHANTNNYVCQALIDFQVLTTSPLMLTKVCSNGLGLQIQPY
jgi:hypothetical protein